MTGVTTNTGALVAGVTERTTFAVLRTGSAEVAERCLTELADQARRVLRPLPAFRSAQLHLGDDGTTVAARYVWDGPGPDGDRPDVDAVAACAGRHDLAEPTLFHGRELPVLEGPDVGRRPGKTVVALRRLPDEAAVDDLFAHFQDTASFKRDFPGFVAATPYRGDDGTSFANYPRWVDDDAFAAWMADPDITGGQGQITDLESDPPVVVICTIRAEITPDDSARPDDSA